MKNEVSENISKFILGGNADFCIVQERDKSGIGQCVDIKYRYSVKRGRCKGTFLVSAGEARGQKLMYLGTLRKASNGSYTLREVDNLNDAYKMLANGLVWVLSRETCLPSRVHVVHNGKCGVCGRPLTDAESVSRGIGPTCIKKIGI